MNDARAPKTSMMIPLVVASAFFIENLDATVITTALPAMAVSMRTTPVELSIGITAYLLSVAVFIPISGWLADRFGTRTVFRSAIGLFAFASLLCGLAESPMQFVAARILQGVGGAMMVPVGRLVVLRSVPRVEFLRAMSYVTVPSVMGQVLGPPLGGFFSTYVSWHWIFFLNVPIGIVGMLLVSAVVTDYRAETPSAFDWAGFAITSSAIVCIMGGLELIVAHRSASAVLALLGAGLLLGVTAIRHARRVPHPVIDLSLLNIPTFLIMLIAGFAFRMAFGAVGYLVPLQLQIGFGMTAFASGALTFCIAVGTLLMKTAAPAILRKYGFRQVLLINGTGCAVVIGALALFTPATSLALIIGVLFASGLLRSIGYTAINSVAYADVAPERMSRASSLQGLADRLSIGVGVSLGAILLHGIPQSATASPDDFRAIFLLVALLALIGVLPFLRLQRNAGSELSGHIA